MGRMNIDKKTTNGLVYTWIIIILADYMFYMHTSLSSRLYGIMVICSFIYILIKNNYTLKITKYILLSNRSLSQVISADYFRRKRLSQSAVDDADAHYIG